jgi:hypothetical protein
MTDHMDTSSDHMDPSSNVGLQGGLHRRGFQVFKNVLRVDEETKREIRATKTAAIFNGDDGARLTTDGKRRQTMEGAEWTKKVTPRLEGVFRELDLLRCSRGEKTLNTLVALMSMKRDPRSKKKYQPPHADSAERNSLLDAPVDDVPLACIVALQDGTRLHVWPFDTGKEEVVTLNEGDMILFRGDLGHAGAEYDEENWRLHIYLDSPVIERAKDPKTGETLTFPFDPPEEP